MGKPDIIENVSEAQDVVNVSIKQKSARYFDEFVNLRCAPDLLSYGLFPNAKEITESMAAFHAWRKYFRFLDPGDPDISVCVVGDGSTPRTAALFAMRTAWQVWSVDPALRVQTTSWKRINRLYVKNDKIEKHNNKWFDLVVLVHAHVLLSDIEAMSDNIICIPCCYPQNEFRGRQPDIDYWDYGIWSPKRNVKIWRGV